ncbi:MAG: TIGR03546 family protein [Planctomycetaceae bacterium]|jgi:uncharacterized protein (TIGR03546 family)|nr:TIGR03546 family protein [Planctomycetaceae bacterium]
MIELIWCVVGGLSGLFLKEKKPHHIALAAAIGVVLGFIPKENLLALLFVLALFLLRCNFGVGILTAAAVSFFAPRLDGFTEQIGAKLLDNALLLRLEANLFQYPFVAWTSLNNTVVLGNFLTGLAVFLPVYLLVFLVCRIGIPQPKQIIQTPQNSPKHQKKNTKILAE